MKRITARPIVSFVVLVASFGLLGAPAAGALAPAVAAKAVPGTYTLHVDWYATHYIRTPLALYPDHTGAGTFYATKTG